MAERNTTVVKAVKTFLQVFLIQCFSVSKSRRELQNESYHKQHTQSWRAYYGVSKDKQMVTNEIEEQLHGCF